MLVADPKRAVDSFASLSVEEWIQAAKRQFYDRRGRLPAPTFEQTHRATIARLRAALERAYGPDEWWRADMWEPRRDRRIPVREHEPLGNYRLRFAEIQPPWLREAIKWFFARALEQGVLAWTSLPGYRTYLGSYFSEFLLGAGIDHPRLVEDESELRGVALQFLSHLRGRRSRRGDGPLSRCERRAVPDRGSGVLPVHGRPPARGRQGAGRPALDRALGRPRPPVAGGRVRPQQESPQRPDRLHRSRGARLGSSATWTSSRCPRDQTKTVIVDGERREVAGRGDPQAMRAFLLEVLTGRRINEILLIDPEPLSPLPGIDAQQRQRPGGVRRQAALPPDKDRRRARHDPGRARGRQHHRRAAALAARAPGGDEPSLAA